MVLGIIGLVFSFIPLFGFFFALPLGILAVVFGAVGLRRVSRHEANNRGAAIAGLVTGLIALVIGLIVFAAVSSAVSSTSSDLNRLDHDTNLAAIQHDQRVVVHQEHRLIDETFIANV